MPASKVELESLHRFHGLLDTGLNLYYVIKLKPKYDRMLKWVKTLS